MAQKYVTNFDIGTENILIRDSNVMHGEGLINVKFPPDNLSPLKGDGSNETTILQNMINYAISENIALFFPEGVYAVDSINVSGKVTFIGSNAIIRKIVSSATPVINATGFLTMRGMKVDGNISVLTAAVVGLNVENAGFDIADCSFTGCSDCIHADINTPSKLYNCSFETFKEYGMYLNGTSYISAFGIYMNVQTNTAIRFMKLNNSNNVIYGLESMSEVPIGVEITGDFNYISARIPNCENPVSDSGQNNNFEIIDQLSKRTYQNLMMQVSGDYTQSVGEFDVTATGHYGLSAPDIILKPTKPLTYKTPLNGKIPFKDYEGNEYNLITDAYATFVNVKNYGAVGDGVTDDTDAFKAALTDMDGGTLFIPNGDYIISDTLTINKPINIYGASAYMDFAFGYYGSVIHFKGNVQTLFDIKFSGTNIENLVLKNESSHNNPYAICLSDVVNEQTTANINHVYRCIYITDFGAGILQICQTVFECLLEKCWVNGCTVGFLFTSGTSITFLNCWTTWCKEVGYNLQNNAYCSFINCAADNNAKVGYSLVNLLGCSLINCGCETTGNDTSNITSPVVSIVNCKNVDFSCLFSSCKGIAGDTTLLIQMTGSSYVKIHDCTLVGDVSHKFDWFVLDTDGKNNSLYNIVNNLTGFTPNARINGQDIGINFVLETKAST